jgi:hypothetical protein
MNNNQRRLQDQHQEYVDSRRSATGAGGVRTLGYSG